jgi:hypothetical protein
MGAKAATLAGTFTGREDNTSAIYYNPAGLAFQSGLGFRLNVVIIASNTLHKFRMKIRHIIAPMAS